MQLPRIAALARRGKVHLLPAFFSSSWPSPPALPKLNTNPELYLFSAQCFSPIVPLQHDIRTASAVESFVFGVYRSPSDLHLLLLCPTMSHSHGQLICSQRHYSGTEQTRRGSLSGSSQQFFCPFLTVGLISLMTQIGKVLVWWWSCMSSLLFVCVITPQL